MCGKRRQARAAGTVPCGACAPAHQRHAAAAGPTELSGSLVAGLASFGDVAQKGVAALAGSRLGAADTDLSADEGDERDGAVAAGRADAMVAAHFAVDVLARFTADLVGDATVAQRAFFESR